MRLPRVTSTVTRQWRSSFVIAWASSTVLVAFSGCVGGQTGAEAAPTNGAGGARVDAESGSTPGGNGTGVPTSNVDTKDPTVGAGCSSNPTDLGALEQRTGMTEASVVDFVHAVNQLEIAYSDGSTTTASITLTRSVGSCVLTESASAGALAVPVSAQLVSDDGRVNLRLIGTALARAGAEGGVADVELSLGVNCEGAVGSAGMLPCLVSGIDESAYARVAVELSARVQRFGAWTQLLGSLRVTGNAQPSCAVQPCVEGTWATVALLPLSRRP